jgi:hypothetical protein
MNKLLIALTVGLLASSAAFAQASSIPGTAPANTVAAAAPASTAKSGAMKKSKKTTHKAKAAASAPAAVDPNEAHH